MVRLEGCYRKRSARLTQIGVLLLALAGLGRAFATTLPRATNLAALATEAQTLHVPIVLFFWSPTCRYCAVVDRDFLRPAIKDPRFRQFMFRRVNIDSHKALVDFAGHTTTEARFAKRFPVRLVPDIKFFDPKGRKVVGGILGVANPSFYTFYLDAALKKAQGAVGGHNKIKAID